MEYTNDFLARVYGAYYGCECIAEMQVYHFNGGSYPYTAIGGIKLVSDTEIILSAFDDTECADIQYCKLLLTPLSEISDEDAIEVAKLNRVETSNPELVGRSIIHWRFIKGYHREFNAEMQDYLRSKGYDCGYGEIPSLIEAGIAIKKQQP